MKFESVICSVFELYQDINKPINNIGLTMVVNILVQGNKLSIV